MTKKHNNESVDTNMESLSQAESFIKKNNKKIIIAVVAIVAVVIGYLVFDAISDSKDKAGQEAYTMVEESGDLTELEKYLEEYDGHTVEIAEFSAGIAAFEAKDYNKAIKYFSEYESEDELLAARALACIGDCYAHLGDIAKAYENYALAVAKADNMLASEYAFRAGLAAEKLNKKDKALAMYKLIQNKYPSTPRAMGIDKYISRAEAK